VKNTTEDRLDLSIDKSDPNIAPKTESEKLSDGKINDETKDDVIKVWKGAFHPSVMIRKQKVQSQKDTSSTPKQTITSNVSTPQSPLIEQKSNSASTLVQGNTPKGQLTTSKKKSKGFSLMAKPTKPQPLQKAPIQPQPSLSNSNTIKPQPTHQFVYQQSKQFGAITTQPSTHYGTRLLLNEPLYLPRSVGPIAPITTTLQQIIAQARKPPFLTKKYIACTEFQTNLKFNQICSMFGIMVKVAENLGIRDRMSLRCVNKAWRSVIDSDQVWSRIKLTKDDSDLIIEKYIDRLESYTREIYFEDFGPVSRPAIEDPHGCAGRNFMDLVDTLTILFGHCKFLEQVTIRSSCPPKNTFARSIINSLVLSKSIDGRDRPLHIIWNVKVGIDPYGVASAQFSDDAKSDAESFEKVSSEDLYDLQEKWANGVIATHETGSDKPIKITINPM